MASAPEINIVADKRVPFDETIPDFRGDYTGATALMEVRSEPGAEGTPVISLSTTLSSGEGIVVTYDDEYTIEHNGVTYTGASLIQILINETTLEGIDYAAFYENASPIMKELVEDLYAEAGLDIDEDIERINSAPRITASDYALEYWGQPGRTADGNLLVPTIRVHSLGDNSIPYSLMQGYQALVEEKGKTDLYRQSLLKFTDHCGFETAETTALVEVMMERLETEEWPDTSPEALNAAAAELDLDEARFMEEDGWRVEEYNRTWIAGE